MLLSVASCGPNLPRSRQIKTPDGYTGFTIECGTAADCYDLAGQSCPYSYNVIHDSWHTERYQDPAAPFRGAQAGLQGRAYDAQTYAKDVMTLVIECYDK
ncbi:MAG: hypothetical protein R3B89_30515 [Polyangiaceae bacterium]